MIRTSLLVRCAFVAALLGPLSAVRLARADDQPNPAASSLSPAELKKIGDDAMDAHHYDEALAAYSKAYAASRDPALLYNMGRARQFRGEYPEALALLERFSTEASPELRAKVPGLANIVEEVKGRVTTLTIQCNVSGARVLLRQRVVATTPVGPLKVSSGPATLEVEADGYNLFHRDVVLPGGGNFSADVNLLSRDTAGLLHVNASPPGGVVYVDGRTLGNPPVEESLVAGTHRILVQLDGYEDANSEAVVFAGQRKDVDLELQKTPPITSRWWFWTGVGAVVAGGIVLSYALLTEKSPGQGDISPGRLAVP
jgi:PEGA domain